MAQETSELTLFESTEFGTLRTVQKDGEAWFVANDIMEMFQATNRNRLMQSLDDNEKGYTQTNTPGGMQQAAIVSESGLYSLLFYMTPTRARGVSPEYIARRSDQLRAFRRWVTHDVIPAIRRNGFYVPTDQTLSDRLSPREQLRAARDVSGLLKSINHVMSLQGSTSRKIASTVKGICEHYGIPLPDDFVEPERVTQTTAADMNEAHLERIRRRIISAEELRQAEERARRDALKTVARMREEFDLEMSKGGR